MKNITAIILIFLCLLLLISPAVASEWIWHCDKCDADRNTAFCPECGAARPVRQNDEDLVMPWPTMELSETDTSLRPMSDEDGRHQSYFGPSSQYPGDGAYKPQKARSVKALFREGNFVLTDLTYPTVGRRILYFKAGSLTNSDVDDVTLTGYPARTIAAVVPKQGPGEAYDDLKQTKHPDSPYEYVGTAYTVLEDGSYEFVEYYGYFDKEANEYIAVAYYDNDKEEIVSLSDGSSTSSSYPCIICMNQGTEINVFFETNGWVYAEFSCSLGTVRAWFPIAAIEY